MVAIAIHLYSGYELGNTVTMSYCPECGSEVEADAKFCSECGATLSESNDELDSSKNESSKKITNEWSPKLPITSVFASVLLIWVTFDAGNIIVALIYGLPGLLIIPRVRRYVIHEVKNRYNRDLTTKTVKIAIGAIYGILTLMAAFYAIGSALNDPTVSGPPTQQITVTFLMFVFMYLLAILIVWAIRLNRKLRD